MILVFKNVQLQSKVVHKNVIFLIKVGKKSVLYLRISFIFSNFAPKIMKTQKMYVYG